MAASEQATTAFGQLVQIMEELREQCPWDRKQTIHTLRQQSIEELYELADAISTSDWKGIKEELGDLFLHLVFYAKIGTEQNQFTLDEVLNGICEKLIRRHPHIYGDVEVKDAEEVKKNWEQLKLKEGKTSVLSGVPQSLPATVKAMRLQEKAKQVGFEWDNREQVWDKVEEEMQELHAAVASGDQEHAEEEFGDLVFSLINYARFLHLDAENALERTNRKFIHRFTAMEARAAALGKSLRDMTLTEMDALWNDIKAEKRIT
ncbi:nucleoside triphosphate pyrophosphohydrolase [Flavihumibacter petaseus]|uniref:Nucleoside triphosphate pyrophosphohydrolase n=1 Tax=Flavihumibacter petaseus NBRC 106054 TaxID=1220578 RepID=A0A0E9N009_9BACT|nr:nucleoside triphosphate pyrophosphohydrolase [Flavihumibacter petaseus]GAO43154.1 nucleoside triphosphate pyrophosphohydrolase [Flavihumibacter petaseus NBRC 106054]